MFSRHLSTTDLLKSGTQERLNVLVWHPHLVQLTLKWLLGSKRGAESVLASIADSNTASNSSVVLEGDWPMRGKHLSVLTNQGEARTLSTLFGE